MDNQWHISTILFLIPILVLSGCRVEIDDGIYRFEYDENKHCESRNHIQQVMLERINNARARQRRCGVQTVYPAPPIIWNPQLFSAARIHVNDMANYDFMAFMGSDGSFVEERVNRTGYLWVHLGENIGTNYQSPDSMIDSWLNNPNDCINIMNPHFSEIGAACAHRNESQSQYAIYWTLVLATHR
ncbi:CAP domain-containing protein [Candidatus Parabeggiatoa sp. HSG14]|uniref:CAP domain-containing protein n=1 Tax=Candidatus Parabeggiatoa sp. HSG14 TaxID=3055593 RepID=UPI0025A7674B|nr:CAP domain-containing protein [Thiotrichales bacterium HSG14]